MLDVEKELLLESLPGMAYRCDVEAPWRMHYVSPGVQFVCSFTPSDFTSGRVEWGRLIHPDDLTEVDQELEEALKARRQFNFHYRIVDPDLGIRWVNEAGQAIFLPSGKAEALVGFIIDVTAHEQVQERLREAQDRYALAAKATGEIIWDRDLDTGIVNRTVPENSAFADGDDAILNRHDWWERRVHPEDARRVQHSIEDLLATGKKHWSVEYRLRRSDGSYAHIFDQGFLVLTEGGRKRRMVGAMQDISERKAAEAQVEQLQAELIHLSQNAAMGAMAATLAHELNQPLAAAANYVVGSARLTEKLLGSTNPVRSGLQYAEQQIQRAGEIIRRMRGLVRQGELRREPVSLTASVHRVRKLIKAAGVCPGVEICASIHKDADRIFVDQIQIEQVLLNLLRNACEAIGDDDPKEINVEAQVAEAGFAKIEVRDQGSGMSDEILEGLFTVYGVSTSGGLGVGLSISRTIVEAHGGKIRAQNNAQKGATFAFTVPLA